MDIVVTPEVTPTFAPIGPLCQNSTAPPLPAASIEGITGTWAPATISTAYRWYYYLYIHPGSSGVSVSLRLLWILSLLLRLPQHSLLSVRSARTLLAPALPAASIEGITGTWAPATISTATLVLLLIHSPRSSGRSVFHYGYYGYCRYS